MKPDDKYLINPHLLVLFSLFSHLFTGEDGICHVCLYLYMHTALTVLVSFLPVGLWLLQAYISLHDDPVIPETEEEIKARELIENSKDAETQKKLDIISVCQCNSFLAHSGFFLFFVSCVPAPCHGVSYVCAPGACRGRKTTPTLWARSCCAVKNP